MIRIATEEDFELVREFALKFLDSLPYRTIVDEDKVDEIVKTFLKSDRTERVVLMYGDIGMLAGSVTPFIFGNVIMASEIGWWIEPEHRGKAAGRELLKAFEYWAKQVGCSAITMVSLDERLGKFYEKNGYKLYERAYVKEI
jgi:GNAT superfamily N-acetyltransferase